MHPARGVREPGESPGLTRSGEGDGRGTPETAATGETPGRRPAPVDPESEDLLALAAIAARSPGPRDRVHDQTGFTVPTVRDRRDRCPGALRPWSADDGLLVRLRLIGGHVRSEQLLALSRVAERFGDGRVYVTNRTNLQVRGLPAAPGESGRLDAEALAAVESTGLLPTRTHELVRNVMISPQSGLSGGRADLRGVGAQLDRLLRADPALADLPGRFLFALDDGRGDLLYRTCDLGLVALDASTAQLRVGDGWSREVLLSEAAQVLSRLASRFLAVRGSGPSAPWHVNELMELTALTGQTSQTGQTGLTGGEEFAPPAEPDPRLPEPSAPLAFGDVPGGRHVAVPESGLDRVSVEALTAGNVYLIVTPWRGVLIPQDAR